MSPLLLALLAAAAAGAGRREETQRGGPFVLKLGRTYRVRVQIHRINVPITQQLIDGAKSQLEANGIRDMRLQVVQGKTFIEATITVLKEDIVLPGGRVVLKYPPVLDAEVEYIFARELGPPGV